MINIQDLLTKKRHNQELNSAEINYFIKSACDGTIHDSQIGALLMAIAINGLSIEEAISLTQAMVNSGKVMDWKGITVDKHSTGGVGDKVSIPLVPALASCGLTIPMMSGRGLGLTGGTLDKLESIKGFKVNLNTEQMNKCIETVGCFIASTTKDICPGDKATYQFRDVTSTVDCIGLIIGSILSKKIAEGTKYLVLDVKTGSAALYKTVEGAQEVAELMIVASKKLDLKMKCVITSMDEPIGCAVGNALEIQECIECLHGNGPVDLVELVTHFGGELLAMCNKASSVEEGKKMILNVINNGAALERFKEMCIAQGVTPDDAKNLCQQKYDGILPTAKNVKQFKALKSGWVRNIQALPLAKICWQLGSGRKGPNDVLDLSVGLKLLCKTGSKITSGDCWLELHHNIPLTDEMSKELDEAIEITSKNDFQVPSRIIKTVE